MLSAVTPRMGMQTATCLLIPHLSRRRRRVRRRACPVRLLPLPRAPQDLRQLRLCQALLPAVRRPHLPSLQNHQVPRPLRLARPLLLVRPRQCLHRHLPKAPLKLPQRLLSLLQLQVLPREPSCKHLVRHLLQVSYPGVVKHTLISFSSPNKRRRTYFLRKSLRWQHRGTCFACNLVSRLPFVPGNIMYRFFMFPKSHFETLNCVQSRSYLLRAASMRQKLACGLPRTLYQPKPV